MAKKKKGKKGGVTNNNNSNNKGNTKQNGNNNANTNAPSSSSSLSNNSSSDRANNGPPPPVIVNGAVVADTSTATTATVPPHFNATVTAAIAAVPQQQQQQQGVITPTVSCCGMLEGGLSLKLLGEDAATKAATTTTEADATEKASTTEEDELIAAFQNKCSVSPSNSKHGSSNSSNSSNINEAETPQKTPAKTPPPPALSNKVPSYLRPTVSSAKKKEGATKSPAASPATSPSSVGATLRAKSRSPPPVVAKSTPPPAPSSPPPPAGSSSTKKNQQKKSADGGTSTADNTSSSRATPAAATTPVAKKKSPPPPPPPAKEVAGSCCSGNKPATTTTTQQQPPPSNTTHSITTTSVMPATTVCCGCGDNCHCCIENGWSYCQCGPSCRCSNPLMAEQASLILECTKTGGGSGQQGSQTQAARATADDDVPQLRVEEDADLEAQTNGTAAADAKNKLYFVDIVVGGMTCTMCSQALTNALNAMKEVQSVNVSLSTDLAHVVFDSQHLTASTNSTNNGDPASRYGVLVEQVQELIGDIGYVVVDVMTMPNVDLLSSDNTAAAVVSADGNNDGVTNNATSSTQQERWDTIAQRQGEKLANHRSAFMYSLVGTIPILLLTMVLPHVLPHANPAQEWWHRQHVHLFGRKVAVESLLLWFLATPVQFICGWDFYKSSYYQIFRTGSLGMDVLVVLGTTASYGYALYATFTDQASESHFFETSAVLICFVLLGKWMQALAVHRTSDALSSLMKLQPLTAIRILPMAAAAASAGIDGSWDPMREAYREETVPTNQLQQGDTVKIVPGASLPADGVVLAGELAVDESMVTGESLPVLKTKSSVVLGGTVCVESSASNSGGQVAFCRVTGVGSSTALAQIIQLVQDAQASKVPSQAFADTVSSIFVPVVATLSIVTFLVWYALCSSGVVPEEWYTDLNEDAATFSLMFGIACLVISCPCALGLATPTAVMVGTGIGAKLGILMKGGEALEAASKVNAVVLDKTGTVTRGIPAVTDFLPLTKPASSSEGGCCSSKKKMKDAPQSKDGKPLSKETILWLLGSLERSSEHPLAKAIVSYAEKELLIKKKGVSYLEDKPFLQPSDFRSMTGRGASGYMRTDASDDSHPYHVAVGNRAFFSSLDSELTVEIDEQMKVLEEQGKTAVLGAINNQFCVVLGVADELKPDAIATVAYLRNVMYIDVWMVTGDNARTAQAIAKQLNLPPQRVVSEALPNAKVHQVKKLQQQGFIVAHVGDGINDSPALAQADVGISMGTGAAIAAEASDMVLVRGNYVADVCIALDLCRVIFSRIKWNFMWSLIYNCLGIPLAAGVCFPIFHTRLPPTVAALAMALSSISVVFSSLALRLYRPPPVLGEDAGASSNTSNSSSQQARSTRSGRLLTSASLDGSAGAGDLTQPLLANGHLSETSPLMGALSMEGGHESGESS